jgi:hypothetical protein
VTKDTFALENLLDDLHTISTCLEQLRCMDGAMMHAPENVAAYHRTLEAAYGRIETVIDGFGQRLEDEHSRLMPLFESTIAPYSERCRPAEMEAYTGCC